MVEEIEKHPGGRPSATQEELDEIFRKLEPFLKQGLSIHKSCSEAQVPKSTVYDYIRLNPEFSEKVKRAQQFLSVILSNTMIRELHNIIRKQTEIEEEFRVVAESAKIEGKPKPKRKTLSESDRKFLWNFALNSNLTREEFGQRQEVGIFDPEAEIQRILTLIKETSSRNRKEKSPSE